MFLFTSQDGVSATDMTSTVRSRANESSQNGASGDESFSDLYSADAKTELAKKVELAKRAVSAAMAVADDPTKPVEQAADGATEPQASDSAKEELEEEVDLRLPLGPTEDPKVRALTMADHALVPVPGDLSNTKGALADRVQALPNAERGQAKVDNPLGMILSSEMRRSEARPVLPSESLSASGEERAKATLEMSSMGRSLQAIGSASSPTSVEPRMVPVGVGKQAEAAQTAGQTASANGQHVSSRATQWPLTPVVTALSDSRFGQMPVGADAGSAESGERIQTRPESIPQSKPQSGPVVPANWALGPHTAADGTESPPLGRASSLVLPDAQGGLSPLLEAKIKLDSSLLPGQTTSAAQQTMSRSATPMVPTPLASIEPRRISEPSKETSATSDGDQTDVPASTPHSQTAVRQPDVAPAIASVAQMTAHRAALVPRMTADQVAEEAERFSVPADVDFTVSAMATSESRASTGPTPVAPPTAAQGAASQIARAAIDAGGLKTELVLDPKELGKVRLQMVSDDRAITLHLMAERPETLDLLRRNIETLEQEFRDLGFDDVTFTFGEQATSDGRGETSTDAAPPSNEVSGAPDAEVPQSAPRIVTNGQLDIRL